MKRVQTAAILADLQKKMVLLAGPRQAGKTTLAKSIMSQYKNPVYLNYDQLSDRKIIEGQAWLKSTDLLILDELHKMQAWKNYLKGLYDTRTEHLHILVTGSARLEVYREVGDSLAGRYYLHRLLPLSVAELSQLKQSFSIERLVTHGNFPEPYLDDLVESKRWRKQYADSLVREDVFEFEKIQNMRAIQLVFELLRERVGSPVSYQSIANDVGISVNTVKHYIAILEALYIVFRVTPHHRNIARSILKEPKIYFYDVGMVKGDKGFVIENLVAVSLLKHCLGLQDNLAKNIKLQYLRTKDQQEVDFVLIEDNKIQQGIEVKLTDSAISKSLQWFVEKYKFNAVQVVYNHKSEYQKNNIMVSQLEKFLAELYL